MNPYETAAADYRNRLGWPAYALGTVVWTTAGVRVEAFNVPRPTGERVAARIALPVINIPGPPDRWSLLTRPHNGILNLPTNQDIGYAHKGPTCDWSIDLPPTRHTDHEPLSWITPADTPLPAALTVAQLILHPNG